MRRVFERRPIFDVTLADTLSLSCVKLESVTLQLRRQRERLLARVAAESSIF